MDDGSKIASTWRQRKKPRAHARVGTGLHAPRRVRCRNEKARRLLRHGL